MSSTIDTTFTASEWLRYTRHIQLPQLGAEGQARLKQSHVLIVGCGGLGSPVSLYLAAAGVGHITLVDGDIVDVTNLQRQILFGTEQVGENKAESGKQRLQDLNPDIDVSTVTSHLTPENAEDLITAADLVIDCTDNFSVRYLINDLCVENKKPWLFSAIHQFKGQCALFLPGEACFRCLFPEVSAHMEDCNTAGVLGVLPGILGTIQATEAIKYLVGLPTPLKNNLLLVDALDFNFQKIKIIKDESCLACGENKKVDDSLSAPSSICAKDTTCPTDITGNLQITPEQFEVLKNQTDVLVLDVRSDVERRAFNIGGEHIPLDSLEDTLQRIDQDKQILCYCQTGIRSGKAAKLLVQKGFNANSLKGGLVAYLKCLFNK